MMWWQGRMVAFDVETTGVDTEEDRIVTAAVALCGGGEPTETLTWLVNPGVDIPEEAAAVHGITTAQAQAAGMEPAEAIADIVETLTLNVANGCPVVAFNAPFDLTILDREARRYGIEALVDRVVVKAIDPLVIDRHLDKYRKGSRKLDAICAHYGATLDNAHDADADAVAAARAAWVLGSKGQIVRRVFNAKTGAEKAALVREWDTVRGDLGLLHEAQAGWYHEWASGFRDYLASKGEDASGVCVQWPYVPAVLA